MPTEGATGFIESFDDWDVAIVEGATGQTESFDAWDLILTGAPPGAIQKAQRQPGYPENVTEVGGSNEAPRQMGL